MSSAITAAVLNYYTPFGLIAVVDGLFSLATALNFEPIVFAAGSADIAGIDLSGLDKIAELMQQRPGIAVTLCAYTNTADRELLIPDTAAIEASELELDGDQLALLAELGEARAAAVKTRLAQRIDPARLVICASEHREGDNLAGVEISI